MSALSVTFFYVPNRNVSVMLLGLQLHGYRFQIRSGGGEHHLAWRTAGTQNDRTHAVVELPLVADGHFVTADVATNDTHDTGITVNFETGLCIGSLHMTALLVDSHYADMLQVHTVRLPFGIVGLGAFQGLGTTD